MDKVKPKSYDTMLEAPSKEAHNKKVYPTIRIDHDHFPEGKKMGVGERHHIHMNVKMVGNSQSRFQNEGEYEIHGIDHCDQGCDGEHHEHTLPAEEDGKEDKKDLEEDDTDIDHKVE